MYLLENLETGEQFELNTDEIKIGRAEHCAVKLSGELISREHARIYSDGNQVFVEDLNSTNGSQLNYKTLKTQKTLSTADVCSFGNNRFVFLPKTGLANSDTALAEPLNNDTESFLVEGGVDGGTALRHPVVTPPAWSLNDYKSFKNDSGRYSAASIQKKLQEKQKSNTTLLAQFILLSNHSQMATIEVNRNFDMRWTIGRNPNSDICLKHPTVSDAHAILSFKDDQWLLEVVDAKNPLYVNNQMLTRCRLSNECLVRLGEVDYLFTV